MSVTLCVPGTNECQTIPNIILDTGSTGLRIFSTVLKLNLPTRARQGIEQAECFQFPGGDYLWGPIRVADVILGAERASRVSIQINDAHFSTVPSSCTGTLDQDPSSFGGNGILGVSPALTDCDGLSCPGIKNGKSYFTCSGNLCESLSPSPALQVQNPVALMPEDNNGVMLEFPAVSSASGDPLVTGYMMLGIGTQLNNSPTYAEHAYSTDLDGNLLVHFGGETYWTKLDSGTNFWTFPSAPGIAVCGNFLCPTSPTPFFFSLQGLGGEQSPPFHFSLGNSQDLLGSSNIAFDNIAWNNALPNQFTVSMPFFYGRRIFIGISGKISPLGSGPYYGF